MSSAGEGLQDLEVLEGESMQRPVLASAGCIAVAFLNTPSRQECSRGAQIRVKVTLVYFPTASGSAFAVGLLTEANTAYSPLCIIMVLVPDTKIRRTQYPASTQGYTSSLPLQVGSKKIERRSHTSQVCSRSVETARPYFDSTSYPIFLTTR